MKFIRLVVEGYGRFRQPHEFRFEAGLNCIVGANEAGKSTLLNALLDALYTLPTTTAQLARERIHWGHPHGWRVELELELRGTYVRLSKFHPVDDPRRRAEFWLEVGGETLQGEAARARWEELWRVPQEVYLATACVRQRELAQLSPRSLRSLQQQLRESAVNADLNRILNALTAEQRRLRAQAEEQQAHLRALEERLHQAREAARKQHELQTRLRQIQAEIETLRPNLERDEQLLARWHALRAQQEQLERLQRQADANQRHLEQLERLEQRARALETELQTEFVTLSQLPLDFKVQVDAAHQRYQEAMRRLSALEADLQAQRQAQQQAIGRRKARVGFAITGVALLAASAALWSDLPLAGAVALVLGVVALGIALLWRAPRETSAPQTAQHAALREEAQHYWQQLVALLARAGFSIEAHPHNGVPEAHSAIVSQQLQQALHQLHEQWNRMQHHRAELERVRHQIEALQAVHDPKALRDQQRTLAVEIVGLQERIAQEATLRAALTPEAALRLENDLQRAQEHLRSLEEERLRCEGALQALPETEPIDALELEYSRAQRALHHGQTRLRVLETTETLLRETNARYLSDLSPRLKPKIEQYLPTLTLGRYTRAELDNELTLQVYHPERGTTLFVEDSQPAWSAGVLDQLFFACRLGLSDALSEDLRLPLLLDEPFVHFDAERARAALELLLRIAQYTQVLLFTNRALPAELAAHAHTLQLPPVSRVL